MKRKEPLMAKDLDTGYFDPAQASLNAGFGDLAGSALESDAELLAIDEGVADYDEASDLQDLISLGLHMAD